MENLLLNVEGTIFNVQSYCIHDGPGIRATVFVKGCPLSCRWCQNPESQRKEQELMFYADKCTACGMCVVACPLGAVSLADSGKAATRRDLCTACGVCVAACPVRAREITGKTVTVEEVLRQVLSDKLFFDGSGGGMTVSGGEPLMQPDFTAALLACARMEGVHTAIETCNFASRAVVDQVYAHVDLALCDLKHMDCAAHRRITGVPNDLILDNLIYIRKTLRKPMEIRVPVVPGYNGDLENIAATAEFIAERLGTDVPLRLLPYHRMGESKGHSLEKADCELHVDVPDQSYMEERKVLAESYGLSVFIDG